MSVDPRQIIQIAATSLDRAEPQTRYLYALCEDGSVWERVMGDRNIHRWVQISREGMDDEN